MRISPDNIVIPVEKITGYLLAPKEKNDKSLFLTNLGYSLSNWGELVNDIRRLAETNEAVLQQKTVFGDIYEIKGPLKERAIVTIWLFAIDAENYRFITLYPDK